jgi:hypothetical protein
MKAKKIPLRKCLGCQEQFSKKELLRIVRTSEGDVVVDTTGKVNGRGAYICAKLACFKLAEKKKAIQRALEVEIPKEILLKLEEEVQKHEK